MKIWSIGTDAKTVKGERFGVRTAICYLAPANAYTMDTGKKRPTLCPHAGACADVCLARHSGRMVFANVQQAQIERTRLWWNDRPEFIGRMLEEARAHVKACERDGFRPAFRPNGASDILWERECPELLELAESAGALVYDYTKIPLRFRANRPAHYHLTFSRDERNHAHALDALRAGSNVAIVSADIPAGSMFQGFPTVDGDAHDVRVPEFDGRGRWIVLKPKGSARRDTTGFVYRLPVTVP